MHYLQLLLHFSPKHHTHDQVTHAHVVTSHWSGDAVSAGHLTAFGSHDPLAFLAALEVSSTYFCCFLMEPAWLSPLGPRSSRDERKKAAAPASKKAWPMDWCLMAHTTSHPVTSYLRKETHHNNTSDINHYIKETQKDYLLFLNGTRCVSYRPNGQTL